MVKGWSTSGQKGQSGQRALDRAACPAAGVRRTVAWKEYTIIYYFEPYKLDLAQAGLWRAEQRIALRPKTLALLAYLVAHAGQVVTKTALLDALWPETMVGDGVLKTSMGELRKALGDTAKTPQWIATVHGRGYRFVAPVTRVTPAVPPEAPAAHAAPAAPPTRRATPPTPAAPCCVAREAELALLHTWYAHALQGERQVGFLTGEAGMGKTTLINAFVAQLAGQTPLWLGQGQCIEQYGAGEAYMPLLDALGQLGRTSEGAQLVTLLRQQAPSWLVQLPALWAPGDAEALQRATGGVTRERMLRELAEAVEVLTATQPLVLVLEDLHWSDTATIEWLAYVARRRGPARLLVLGTYRPVEAIVRAHPVRAMVEELLVHRQGAEWPLREWAEADVAAYLRQRGAGADVPASLARVLTARTDGHPLFLVAMVDELVQQGGLRLGPAGWEVVGGSEAVMGAMPPSIAHLLDRQVAQLPRANQTLLAAASVAGVEFTVAAVAAGLQQPDEAIDLRCDTLARQYHLLQTPGTAVWPDGTITARYRFRHALYQELLYAQVPVSRRARWHQQIGLRLEAGYGAQARERAAELAMHFERGRDAPRAVRFLQQAADEALRRSAHREAIRHCHTGIALLKPLPQTPAHTQQALALHIALGAALQVTHGHTAPEVEHAYAQAYAWCQQGGETPELAQILLGLWRCAVVRPQLHTARAIGETLLRLAQRADDPALAVIAHYALGTACFYLGAFPAARWHLEEGLARYTPDQHQTLVFRMGSDPGVGSHAFAAVTCWVLGYPEHALAHIHHALAVAHALAHPYSLAWVWCIAAWVAQFRREVRAVSAHAEAAVALATAQGFPQWAALGTIARGWAVAMQSQGEVGLALLRQGIAAWQATGSALGVSAFALWRAEVSAHLGHLEDSLQALDEALILGEQQEEHRWEAEICRLRGVVLLRQPGAPQAEAEAWFQRALDVARRQEAKSLELRAALSLARLWQQQGKRAEAHALLAPLYGWFTEGFDTADLQEAKALLEALA